MGEIGKSLQDIAPTRNLSGKIKEKYGGLKKFLERYPEDVVICADHPFNPHVFLRKPLSVSDLDLIGRGFIPPHLRKAMALRNKMRGGGTIIGALDVFGQPPAPSGQNNTAASRNVVSNAGGSSGLYSPHAGLAHMGAMGLRPSRNPSMMQGQQGQSGGHIQGGQQSNIQGMNQGQGQSLGNQMPSHQQQLQQQQQQQQQHLHQVYKAQHAHAQAPAQHTAQHTHQLLNPNNVQGQVSARVVELLHVWFLTHVYNYHGVTLQESLIISRYSVFLIICPSFDFFTHRVCLWGTVTRVCSATVANRPRGATLVPTRNSPLRRRPHRVRG